MMASVKVRFNFRDRRKATEEPENEDEVETESRSEKNKRLNSEKCKRYRAKQIKDENWVECERVRSKIYRLQMTPERRERSRELGRIRNQKYRVRLKEIDIPKKKTTRKQQEETRKYWRDKKRESRVKLGSQKKRRVKEYDRSRKTKSNTKPESTVAPEEERVFSSPEAFRQAKYRAKRCLPRNSKSAARILTELVKTASPRKKSILEQNCIVSPRKKEMYEHLSKTVQSNLTKGVKRNVCKQFAKNIKGHKYGQLRPASSLLGVRYLWLQRVSSLKTQIERKSKSGKEAQETVKDFYIQANVSTCLPDKKKVVNNKPTHILNQSIAKTYEKFTEEYPETASVIKKTKFWQLRPKNLKTVDNHKWVMCVCPKCTNVEFGVKCIKKLMNCGIVKIENNVVLNDKYDAMNLTLCKRDNGQKFNKAECVSRKCESCGVKFMQDLIKLDLENENKTVEWNRWALDNVTKKMGLQVKMGTVKQCLAQFCEDVEDFSSHFFTATWQYDQHAKIHKTLDSNTLLMVTDYGENFRHCYQDEPGSMHFLYTQTTIHPVVCIYKENDMRIQEDIIIVSNDLLHDCHAVSKYVETAQDLLESRGLVFSKKIRFSDTAASQYRSKQAFSYLSKMPDNNEYHFFGAHHGKGPADGAVAVVKSSITRAIKARNVVLRTSREMFDYCEKELTVNTATYKRTFIFIEPFERPELPSCQTLDGTHKVHSVRNLPSLHFRSLSCFCSFCIGCNEDKSNLTKCENEQYLQSWKTVEEWKDWMKKGKKARATVVPSKKCKIEPANPSQKRGRSCSEGSPKGKKSKVAHVPTNALRKAKRVGKEESTLPPKRCKTTPANDCGKRILRSSNLLNLVEQVTSEKVKKTKATKTNEKPVNAEKVKKMKATKTKTKQESSSLISLDVENNVKKLFNKIHTYLTTLARRSFFNHTQNLLCGEDYETIKEIAEILQPLIEEKYPIKVAKNVDTSSFKVDENSVALFPSDCSKELIPFSNYGEGNCLYKSASMICHGTEDEHVEHRIRTCMELARFDYLYLNQNYIAETKALKLKNMDKIYASFSKFDSFDGNVESLFKKEVRNNLFDQQTAGCWHVHALAEVLGTKLMVVYPEYGGHTVRKHLQGVITPRSQTGSPRTICSNPAVIMWTHTQGKYAKESLWKPNHFVPCFPRNDKTYYGSEQIEANVEVDITDDFCAQVEEGVASDYKGDGRADEQVISNRQDDGREVISNHQDDGREVISNHQDDGREVISNHQDDGREVISNHQDDDTEVISNRQDDGREVISNHQDDGTEVISNRQDDGREVISNHQDDGREVISNHQDDGTEVISNRQDDGREVISNHQDDGREVISNHQDDGREVISNHQDDGREVISNHQDDGREVISNHQDDGTEVISNRQDDGREVISNHQDDGTEVISNRQDDGREVISNHQDDGREVISNHQADGTEVISNRQDDGREVISNHQDDDKEVISNHQDDGREVISNHQDDGREVISNHQDDGTEVISNRQDDGREVISNHQDDDREVISNHQVDGREVISNHQDDGREVISNHQDDGREVISNHQDDGREVISNRQDDGREVISNHQDDGREVISNHQDDGREVISNHQDDGREVISNNQDDGREVISNLQDDGREVISNHQDDGTEVISNRQDDGREVISNHQDDGTEVISNRQDDGREVISNHQDDGREVISNHQADGTEVISNRQDDGREVISNHQDDDKEVISNHQDDGREVISNHQDDGREVISNHQDDGTEVISNRQDDGREVISNHQDDDREVISNHQVDGREVISNHQDDGREVISNHQDDGREVISNHQDDGREVISNRQDDGREVISNHQDDGREVISNHQDDGREVISNHQDDGREVISNNQDDGREVISNLQDDGREVISNHQDDGREVISNHQYDDMEVISNHQDDGREVISYHQDDGKEVISNHQDDGREVISNHQDDGREVISNHQDEGREVISNRQDDGREVISNHQDDGREVISNHQDDGREVISNHQDDGREVISNHQDDGKEVISNHQDDGTEVIRNHQDNDKGDKDVAGDNQDCEEVDNEVISDDTDYSSDIENEVYQPLDKVGDKSANNSANSENDNEVDHTESEEEKEVLKSEPVGSHDEQSEDTSDDAEDTIFYAPGDWVLVNVQMDEEFVPYPAQVMEYDDFFQTIEVNYLGLTKEEGKFKWPCKRHKAAVCVQCPRCDNSLAPCLSVIQKLSIPLIEENIYTFREIPETYSD